MLFWKFVLLCVALWYFPRRFLLLPCVAFCSVAAILLTVRSVTMAHGVMFYSMLWPLDFCFTNMITIYFLKSLYCIMITCEKKDVYIYILPHQVWDCFCFWQMYFCHCWFGLFWGQGVVFFFYFLSYACVDFNLEDQCWSFMWKSRNQYSKNNNLHQHFIPVF